MAVLELMKRGLIGFDEATSDKLNLTKNDAYHDNQNGQDLTKQSLHWLH
ncbi:Segregation and condensation protein A [Moraxella catarrhalis]|nr:Segregation and condensation protein A [Moraxella catarrhalis]